MTPLYFINYLSMFPSKTTSMTTSGVHGIRDCKYSLEANVNKESGSNTNYYCLQDKHCFLYHARWDTVKSLIQYRERAETSVEIRVCTHDGLHRAVLCWPTEGSPETQLASCRKDFHAVVGASCTVGSYLQSSQGSIGVCIQRLGATSAPRNLFL